MSNTHMVDVAITLPGGEEIHFDLPYDQIDAFFNSVYLLSALALEIEGNHLVEIYKTPGITDIFVEAGSHRSARIQAEAIHG